MGLDEIELETCGRNRNPRLCFSPQSTAAFLSRNREKEMEVNCPNKHKTKINSHYLHC